MASPPTGIDDWDLNSCDSKVGKGPDGCCAEPSLRDAEEVVQAPHGERSVDVWQQIVVMEPALENR